MVNPLTIFVVEDDPIARIMLQSAVTESGHRAVLFESGEEAMAGFSSQFASLVILDLNLPGIDGYAFARWVRSQPWGDRVFILVSTGCTRPEDLKQVLDAGADDYIAKPYERGLFRVRLTIALRQLELIEKRKQAEATLKDSELRFSLFMKNLPGVAFLKDLTGHYIFVNETFADKFESPSRQFVGRTDDELWPPDVAQTLRGNDLAAVEARAPVQRIETVPMGESISHWFMNKFPVMNSEGSILFVAGLGIDTTQLRVFEELYRKILQNASDGFLLIAPDGRILEANEAFQRMTGFNHDELLAMGLHQVTNLTPGEVEHKLKELADETGKIFETVYKQKDGESIPVEVSANFLDLAGQRRYIAFFRDISERQKLAEERIKVTRLEAIGLLAGGIAHEFNNALTAVIGNISLAQQDIDAESTANVLLLRALQACRRTSSLTKHLLTFAKGGDPIKRRLSLPKYLQDTVLATNRGDRYRLGLQINSDLWSVEVDPDQLAQAIRAIVKNAHDAMPSGGTIRVRAENKSVVENEISGLSAGRFVKISFSDEGSGVSEELVGRIFDPYFTTKSGSAGLGLSIAYSIVKRHNGIIHVESKPGEGATFTIFLPAYSESRATSKSPPQVQGAIRKILVMDDDPDVCDLMTAVLTRKGYEVVVTHDGVEAIKAYTEARERNQPFHAVVMDLTVPGGLGGMEAQRELLKIDPGVKSVVCSGYSNDPVMANHHSYGFIGRLPKPFTHEELMRSIQELQES